MSKTDLKLQLQPYVLPNASLPPDFYEKLGIYLDLLIKWNAKTNLTAIRDPAEMVRRHFGESLFAAQYLGDFGSLLDFGSGAGFPGIPIQLFYPNLPIVLAESQNKKVAFLREAVRSLELKTDIWAGRVEAMPENRSFDIVTLRAVDSMASAIVVASHKAKRKIILLTTSNHALPTLVEFASIPAIPIPGSRSQVIVQLSRAG